MSPVAHSLVPTSARPPKGGCPVTFAYVASHDLQTPLRDIVRYAQMIEHRYKGNLDPDANDFIAFIVDGGKRMTRLINDLLEYSRVSRQSELLRPTSASEAVTLALRYTM
ncbi:hypothetical protein CU669_19425 [Paramagnetospirillum kuznetsovii]|uniref:histidine kinase n=1 Tax=Paramagnetospirillum kuznetsovii TaxID=2053833 RepID=A0A364NT05_9PROT|nr:histidine kinase dimerization/phospho-acceptor domain-containing protein [Paramagnetospirillum kuznetsovii]RAU20219.1 hypothetical protein CU669_19425 [Paramagnetospirillum kuznetsovii]